jgi:hypothetical protein
MKLYFENILSKIINSELICYIKKFDLFSHSKHISVNFGSYSRILDFILTVLSKIIIIIINVINAQ